MTPSENTVQVIDAVLVASSRLTVSENEDVPEDSPELDCCFLSRVPEQLLDLEPCVSDADFVGDSLRMKECVWELEGPERVAEFDTENCSVFVTSVTETLCENDSDELPISLETEHEIEDE